MQLGASSSLNPDFTASLNVTCAFDACSNHVAADLNDLPNALIAEKLDKFIYIVQSGQRKLQIPLIKTIFDHEKLIEFTTATITYANLTQQTLTSKLEEELAVYGLSLATNQNEAWLWIQSSDIDHFETNIDLTIRSFAEEEPTWYNLTNVII